MSHKPFSANRSLTLEPGLYLVEQRRGKTYAARAWLAKTWHYEPLGTSDFAEAERQARLWFRRLKSKTEAGPGAETMAEAAELFLGILRDETKRLFYRHKWMASREFWHDPLRDHIVFVKDVTGPLLIQFIAWRRERLPEITASTLKKDMVLVRQVLKHAALRGVIDALPVFPGPQSIGRDVPNPRPWFSPEEWTQLQVVAQQRIDEPGLNPRTKRQRQHLLWFCRFMVATALRVDEARAIRVRHVTIHVRDEARKVGKLPMAGMRKRTEYLEIHASGKRGNRVTLSRSLAVPVFRAVSEGKAPNDLLFEEKQRDGFRELLIAAGLRENQFGTRRNLKSLRSTAISHWLLARPTIDLHWLASNVSTSLEMLSKFYLARLGLRRDDPAAWV